MSMPEELGTLLCKNITQCTQCPYMILAISYNKPSFP